MTLDEIKGKSTGYYFQAQGIYANQKKPKNVVQYTCYFDINGIWYAQIFNKFDNPVGNPILMIENEKGMWGNAPDIEYTFD